MNAVEMVTAALSSLSANKLRSFLTMLGILIGVASIIAIMAVGSGGRAAIVSVIESNRLQQTVQILPAELAQPGLPQPGQVLSFTADDFATARQFKGVASVYYTLYGQATVRTSSSAVSASVNAGPEYLNDIGHFVVVEGRMFNHVDVIAHRPVALLSVTLAKKLFPTGRALGQTVYIGGRPIQVIGITASTQVNFLATFLGTDYVYLPGTTCLDIFPWWTISEMDVQVNPGVDKADLAKRIVMALNIRAHNAQAFEDASGLLQGIEKTIGTITEILTLVIGSIAAIALLVGGVGVMNIMLVSVTERTQEIGIRMSLGARRRDILAQFLMESVTITVIGGTLGILLGVLVAAVGGWLSHLPTEVTWPSVVGSFLFSAVIGLVCGIYPANKASRLNPIDALRHE